MEGNDGHENNDEPSNGESSGGGGDTRTEASSPSSSSSDSCYERAARALHQADYLLVLAGAGMSADSGLGTYETMPTRYREFCDPAKLVEAAPVAAVSTEDESNNESYEHNEFQAFWYSFALQYASTTPHEGYAILDNWCHGQKLMRLSSKRTRSSGRGAAASTDSAVAAAMFKNATTNTALVQDNKWWVYTSNVDGHFRRYPSFRCQRRNDDERKQEDCNNANNVCEIHGCAGEFRCSCGIGYFDREQVPRMGDLWTRWNETVERLRPSQRCRLRTETLEELQERQRTANSNNIEDNNNTNNNNTHHDRLPPCQECGTLLLRPNVLLFNDTDENVLAPIQDHRNRYQEWEAFVESAVVDPSTNANLVLVELGCGTSVPAVRDESEEVLADTLDGLRFTLLQQQVDDNNGSSFRKDDGCSSSSDSEGPSDDASSSATTTTRKSSRGSVTLIRINPKDAGIEDERLSPHVVSIHETSLRALQRIDEALDSFD